MSYQLPDLEAIRRCVAAVFVLAVLFDGARTNEPDRAEDLSVLVVRSVASSRSAMPSSGRLDGWEGVR